MVYLEFKFWPFNSFTPIPLKLECKYSALGIALRSTREIVHSTKHKKRYNIIIEMLVSPCKIKPKIMGTNQNVVSVAPCILSHIIKVIVILIQRLLCFFSGAEFFFLICASIVFIYQ